MIPSDQSTFYKFMKDIFLEEWSWSPPLTPTQLSRWFRALEIIALDRIKKAFEIYLCDVRQAKSPPKEGQILEIIKTIPFDTRSVKCTWQYCNEVGSERLVNYFYCREHCDEMILKTDPTSIQAEIIRDAREYAAENKKLGISGYEGFKRAFPELLKSIQKMRREEEGRLARKKVVRAIQDFYDTPLSPDERKKILAELRNVAKDGADRVKCAVNA